MRTSTGVILASLFLATTVLAIVPPKVPGLSIPAEMQKQLRADPTAFMPKHGFMNAIQNARLKKLSLAKGASDTTMLTAYLPVLLMQYSDVVAEWPRSQMENQLFDLHDQWPSGSMTDYYLEVSYGQLLVTGDVYGWIPVSGDSEYYERANWKTRELIREALASSDSTVDFGKYDNDGPDRIPNSGDDDGYVDTIVLIHSGTGGEYGGPEIWSHSSSGIGYFTDDVSANGGTIIVDDYVIQPAVTSGRDMEEIGVFCHEFGHALGLPDLYDYTDDTEPPDYNASEGVGNWALMAGGGGDGSRPSHMSAWGKEMMGWVTPILVTGNWYQQPIPAVVDTPVVYKLWTGGQVQPFTYRWRETSVDAGREYFLIENRRRKKFDDQLPGQGLIIWHIQNSVTTGNDDETNKLVDVEAADNFRDMDLNKNRGDDGDPYPGSEGNRYFNRSSLPSSDTQAGLYSKVAVNNISDAGDTMYADLLSTAPDMVYLGNRVDDTGAGGNSNGYVDPGETVIMRLDLLNIGPTVPEITFTLSTEDPFVIIADSVAQYFGFPEDSVSGPEWDGFEFTVDIGSHYHPLEFIVRGTGGGLYEEDYSIIVMMENLNILLVNDSGNEVDENGLPIIDYYELALDQSGITYYTPWSRSSKGIPSVDNMLEYRTIMWVTGSTVSTISSDEQSNLTSFLDEGGSLYISGQNIAADLGGPGSSVQDSIFLAEYLRAGFERDIPNGSDNFLMTGVRKDPMTNNINDSSPYYFFTSGGNSANNQASPDIIFPLNGATNTMEYFGTGLMGKASGIKYAGEDYRLVYYSFGLEGINEFGQSAARRSSLIWRITGWLQNDARILATGPQVLAAVPHSLKLVQNYPNPFNGTTVIGFEVGAAGPVQIKIFDILGREVNSWILSNVSQGSHELIWGGINHSGSTVASGVYILQVSANGVSRTKRMTFLK